MLDDRVERCGGTRVRERRAGGERAAEQRLGARIGERDAPVRIDGDDAARDVAQHGRRPALRFLERGAARVQVGRHSPERGEHRVELDRRFRLERRRRALRRRSTARPRAACRSGCASCRAAIPLSQNAASAPTAVANSTSTPRSRRRRPSESSSARAGAAITVDGVVADVERAIPEQRARSLDALHARVGLLVAHTERELDGGCR